MSTNDMQPSALPRQSLAQAAQSGALGLVDPPEPQKYSEGETYIGSDTVVSSGFGTKGFLTAYDMSTGKISWQDEFPESCYSGAVSTAGGLVFVGQNNGELQAFNSESGEKLWSFQTGANVGASAVSYSVNGKQYVAVASGAAAPADGTPIPPASLRAGGAMIAFALPQ